MKEQNQNAALDEALDEAPRAPGIRQRVTTAVVELRGSFVFTASMLATACLILLGWMVVAWL